MFLCLYFFFFFLAFNLIVHYMTIATQGVYLYLQLFCRVSDMLKTRKIW